MLTAMAECKGSCEGSFEPPKVECDASASCEASAKADASFAAKCTPPSVDIKFAFAGSASVDTKAKLTYAIEQLGVRLPRLLAAMKKSDLVVDASSELTGAGKLRSAASQTPSRTREDLLYYCLQDWRLRSTTARGLCPSDHAWRAKTSRLRFRQQPA